MPSSDKRGDAVILVTDWFRRTFSDPQVIALTLALALAQRRAQPLYDYPEERVIIG